MNFEPRCYFNSLILMTKQYKELNFEMAQSDLLDYSGIYPLSI